jgi:hypothetical protein
MSDDVVSLEPIVSWPRQAAPGGRYLVTVDLRPAGEHARWPYPQEEYPIGLMLTGQPGLSVETLGDASVVLHRFGGTYGGARFVVTLAESLTEGLGAELQLTLLSAGGVPFHTAPLSMTVTQDAPARPTAAEVSLPVPVDQQTAPDTPPIIGSDVWSVAVTEAAGRTALAFGANDGSLRLWTVGTAILRTLRIGFGPVRVAASQTTNWVAAGSGQDVLIVEPVTMRTLSAVKLRTRSKVTSLCLLPGQRGDLVVVGTGSGHVYRLDPGGDSPLLGEASVTDNPVHALCCLAVDGRTVLVVAGGHDLKLLDAESLDVIGILRGHTGQVNQLAVMTTVPGQVASASDDGTVRIWDVATGVTVLVVPASDWVNAVTEVPQARHPALLAWGDRAGSIWWRSESYGPVHGRGVGIVTALASFMSAERPLVVIVREGGRIELREPPTVSEPPAVSEPAEERDSRADDLFGEPLQQEPEPSMLELMRDVVQEACEALAYVEVSDMDFGGFGTWAEAGASIDVVEPDLDTIDWRRVETYDGGTDVGVVEVEAEVSFEGYMHKSQVDVRVVTVLDFDWNEHYSRVAFKAEHPWRLKFQYLYNPGERPELSYEGVVLPETDPHSINADLSPPLRITGKTQPVEVAENSELDSVRGLGSDEITGRPGAIAQPSDSIRRLILDLARQHPLWSVNRMHADIRKSGRHDIPIDTIRSVLASSDVTVLDPSTPRYPTLAGDSRPDVFTGALAPGPDHVVSSQDAELDVLERTFLDWDPTGDRFAWALRRAFDRLYDGARTGRYTLGQLSKTERAALVGTAEVEIAREFDLAEGTEHDFRLNGFEFEVKFSARGSDWMIPQSGESVLYLLVTASDTQAAMSIGAIRARETLLSATPNRDMRRTLSAAGWHAIRWLHRDAPLPPNALASMAEEDVRAIMSNVPSSSRVMELFRRVQQQPISRTVLDTVCRQSNSAKRVRDVGPRLRNKGIIILSGSRDKSIVRALGMELPAHWWMSVRVSQARDEDVARPGFSAEGRRWVIARPEDSITEAPHLPVR